MSQVLNLVFCGTPRFATPTLEKLVEAGFRIQLVVTQPDKPRGRGMELSRSPVKQRALELGLLVAQPDKIKNNEEFRSQLSTLKPDVIIVVGYGRLIPPWMIDLLGQHQSARIAVAQVPWRCAHSMGDCLR